MNNLPNNILKYFWGDNLKDLSWKKHKKYIAETILEKGDKEAIEWLLKKTDKKSLKNLVKKKNMDSKSKNFWNIYLS